jgi:hypothetical protein
MIVWQLDLQLPMQSVPITSNVVRSNPVRQGVLDTTLFDKFVNDYTGVLPSYGNNVDD